MAKRSTAGRALFYTRDSDGRHETTPSQYDTIARPRVIGSLLAAQAKIEIRGSVNSSRT
jgi:hypothetical protein